MSTSTAEKSTQELKIVNIVSETIDQLQEQPEKGEATFSVHSKLEEGFRAKVQARDLHYVVDEPEELGGTNQAPNPVEYVLGALATCQEIVIKTHAGQLGIDLESVEVDVKGDIDLKGFFNVTDIPPGFENVSYDVFIKTNEKDKSKLEQLKERSLKNCPVLDIIQNPTSVNGTVSFEE